MTNNGGQVDPESGENVNYVDYSFEPAGSEAGDGQGFELPHWTDPPTGEIPRVLSELDSDSSISKFRFSAPGYSLGIPPDEERNADPVDAKEKRSDNTGSSTNSVRFSPDAPIHKRKSGSKQFNLRSGFSREGISNLDRKPITWKAKGGISEGGLGDGGLDSESVSSDEISLPSRRFNVPSFKLRSAQVHNSVKTRHHGDKKGSEQADLNASDAADESVYIPSNFASRKEKILRAQPERRGSDVKQRHLPISRIGTGIGLGVVVLLAFHFGTVTALGVVVVAIILALVEFYDTVRLAGFRPASLLGIAAALSLLVTTYVKGTSGIPLVLAFLVVASMLWYLFGIIRGEPTLNISVTYLGVIWIGGLGSFAALLLRPQAFPHSNGIAFLLGAIIVTVADDTVAYFFGSVFGRHKLAVEISPSKSWEGLIAGSCASVILGALVVPMIAPWTPSSGLVLGIVVAVISPLGDLSESMIKRDLRIKDMGKLLPGHGGMLDRIDGLLFVLPAVYYLLKVLHIS